MITYLPRLLSLPWSAMPYSAKALTRQDEPCAYDFLGNQPARKDQQTTDYEAEGIAVVHLPENTGYQSHPDIFGAMNERDLLTRRIKAERPPNVQ